MLEWTELADLMGPCPLPGDTQAQEGAGASEPSAARWGGSRAAAPVLERYFQQLMQGFGAGAGLLGATPAQSKAHPTPLGDRPTKWATLHPCSPLASLISSPGDSIRPISAKKPARLQNLPTVEGCGAPGTCPTAVSPCTLAAHPCARALEQSNVWK